MVHLLHKTISEAGGPPHHASACGPVGTSCSPLRGRADFYFQGVSKAPNLYAYIKKKKKKTTWETAVKNAN